MQQKQKAVICDIDNCLLYTNFIIKEAEQKGLTGNDKWGYFHKFANCDKVLFNHKLGEILKALENQGYKILLVTARSEKIRKPTQRKLKQNLECDFKMFMRDFDNEESSAELKQKLLDEITKKYSVVFAIDDEEENIRMFLKNGIYTMQSM